MRLASVRNCIVVVLALAVCLGANNGSQRSSAGYANVAGLKVYYETIGNGPPLILLPGGGSTIDTSFGRIIPLLERSHRLIAIETQAEGHTRDRNAPLSFERDADDVAGVLEHLRISRADVLGFSNGGNTAIYLAIRHPQLVKRLVLASTFIHRDALQPGVIEGMQRATPSSMPTSLREAYLDAAPDPSHLPILIQKLATRMSSFRDTPLRDVRAIRSPALLIFGDRDVFRPESFAQMYHSFSRAELAVFPNSTHGQYLGEASGSGPFPFVDSCATLINAFLAQRPVTET